MASFCNYFNSGVCRSCEWIEQDYTAQLTAKGERLRQALGMFPSEALAAAHRTPVESATTGFRDRVKLSVTGTTENPVIGLTGEGELDQGRELLSCPIHHPRLNELIGVLSGLIRAAGLEPYRIATRTGELKGLILFRSPQSGQMYLRMVLRSRATEEKIRSLVPELQKRFPDLVCISANIQPIPHAILEGPEEIFFTEVRQIDHHLGSVHLQLSPRAFVQTNTAVAMRLYGTAAEWIAEARPSRMLELFCGQGPFSFFAASKVGRVLGVDLNPESVRTAQETAKSLGLSHLDFRCADAERVGEELRIFDPDLVLVNPPRRGLGAGLELIRQQTPAHLLYSSCSVGSLGEDLRDLSQSYRLKRAQVFDLFPHTAHFESLVWLERI